MSYDKVIDSAQLDSAMAATANAIRAKTDSTEKITWDASKGFASAIAAISGGAQFATGSFVSRNVYYNPITISGLGFTPSKIFIHISNSAINQSEVGGSEFEGYVLYAIYDPSKATWTDYYTSSTIISLYEDEWEDEETGEMYNDFYAGIENFTNHLKITPTSGGFEIGQYSAQCYGLHVGVTYEYIAWA